jgi:3-phosphoglycerate kinase
MKVNKYIVKATVQTLIVVVGISAISAGISLLLNYINPTGTQIIGTIGIVVMLFCLYNMISIQASILESKDKLKEMSNK